MKVILKYDDPLIRGNQIVKSFHLSNQNEDMMRNLMRKFNGDGLTILPIKVESHYPDGSRECVSVILSSLCEKNIQTINKSSSVKSNNIVHIQVQDPQLHEKKSITETIKNWFRSSPCFAKKFR
jgi:hypothetical protein